MSAECAGCNHRCKSVGLLGYFVILVLITIHGLINRARIQKLDAELYRAGVIADSTAHGVSK